MLGRDTPIGLKLSFIWLNMLVCTWTASCVGANGAEFDHNPKDTKSPPEDAISKVFFPEIDWGHIEISFPLSPPYGKGQFSAKASDAKLTSLTVLLGDDQRAYSLPDNILTQIHSPQLDTLSMYQTIECHRC